MSLSLTINPQLDAARAAEQLAATTRVQITDFLMPESAQNLWQAFQENASWYLSLNRGAENLEVPAENLEKVSQVDREQFMQRVHERASKQFQYLFTQYYISEAIERGENKGHPLHEVAEFLNSGTTLDFFRQLTREPDAREVDVMATRYEPGHFLTMHDDSHARRDRVAAYVLNLTPEWNPDWGGHLAFFDEDGNIEHAFVPRFNVLNVFLVPQRHAVQAVAPFARGHRCSFTGWVHR